MDPEAFLEIANQVSKLNMFPYFELAHCIIMCMYVKEDLQAGAHLFSRKHPLACWVSCMLSIHGGAMFASFLLGEPILASLKNTNSLLIATGAWYVIFYTPFDFGYKVFKFLPVKIMLAMMKEVIRCKKVHDGVVHAAKIYPNGYLIMIIIGTMKGNGTAFLKVLERLLRGVWTPNAVELMQMSFPTKASIAASVIFVLDKKTDILSAPHSLVYFGIVIFFIYFKLSSMLLGIHDPFVPFENLFCALFFGGIWDTLARLLTPASKGDQTSVKGDTAKNGKTDSA
ncbi:trimeric intracellular cation channel type 1B.1-like [Stegodyphus dumicola]|uniref:trimeric intracellular cation channel type 1B.1-like n=1 Tax=Stegodyphus dumicola TaxID=202533 RepID=UPI0015AD36F1|nr:trimeric intracellular cation channel type 1B.1-like [Stegodyphus dumicola]